ncbi:uncharacterized protein [Epargyreus clarus]|uniref:uncharacterized protein isoform X2 n=1 Tax=Epargyreus clarus TaxID=520877 RepID=UPI003C2F2660
MPRVCVFGCRTGGLKLHVFPIHNAERFKTWVEVVSRNMGTPADCGYYKQKRICDKHFADEHKVANNRVSNNAVPTLYLNGNSSEIGSQKSSSSVQPPTQMNQILCQSSTASAEVIEMDHDYCRPTVILSSKENLSTNSQSSTESAEVEMDREHSEPVVIHSSKENLSTKCK